MHSTANAPYIGTVDSAPHGGTYHSVPRLPFKGKSDSAQLTYPNLPAGAKSAFGVITILTYFAVSSLTERVSDRREVKDENNKGKG